MSRGHDRERALVNQLRNEDWFAMRAPASLGVADVVALKDGMRPRLIEVKSTAAGPYEHFGPKDRADLAFAATLAGADAYLVWWPSRGKAKWIASHEWPKSNSKVRVGESVRTKSDTESPQRGIETPTKVL